MARTQSFSVTFLLLHYQRIHQMHQSSPWMLTCATRFQIMHPSENSLRGKMRSCQWPSSQRSWLCQRRRVGYARRLQWSSHRYMRNRRWPSMGPSNALSEAPRWRRTAWIHASSWPLGWWPACGSQRVKAHPIWRNSDRRRFGKGRHRCGSWCQCFTRRKLL